MKKYLLFSGEAYYPSGGFKDFVCDSDDVDLLIKRAEDEADPWYHIIDTDTMKDVAGSYSCNC